MDKNEQENRKKIILSVIDLVLLIVLVVGITYAAFAFTKKGSKLNTITTAKISMSYTEGENGISIVDAYPISDEEGMVLSGDNQVFDFTVSAEFPGRGTSIGYEVTVEKQEGSTLNDTDVKLYLERSLDNTAFSAVDEASHYVGLSESDAFGAQAGEMVLDTSIVNKTQTIYYKLRMWVDEGYEASGESKSFTVKVNVYGSDTAMNSKSYNVLIKTNKTTSNEDNVRINYNSSGNVTLTPNDGYYLSEVRCTNGYSTNANVGSSATTSQTVTINNNGNTRQGTCTVISNPICMSNKMAGACSAGTEVSYRVNDSKIQDFYVLKDEGTTMDLITKVALTQSSWNSTNNNKPEATSAIIALQNATNTWDIDTRLITAEEAETLGCKWYTGENTLYTCPNWLYESGTQWTSSYLSSSRNGAAISSSGFLWSNKFSEAIYNIHAVITISK